MVSEEEKKFNPLKIMGVFWLSFGLIVLIATFFIKSTPQVPLMRGIVTNIIAAALLLAAGSICVIKGK